jgi:hypothetical protein
VKKVEVGSRLLKKNGIHPPSVRRNNKDPGNKQKMHINNQKISGKLIALATGGNRDAK